MFLFFVCRVILVNHNDEKQTVMFFDMRQQKSIIIVIHCNLFT